MHFIQSPLCKIRPETTGSEQFRAPATGQVRSQSTSEKGHPLIHEGTAHGLSGDFVVQTGGAKISGRLAGGLAGNGTCQQGLMIRALATARSGFIFRNPFAVLVGKIHVHSRWSSSEDIS